MLLKSRKKAHCLVLTKNPLLSVYKNLLQVGTVLSGSKEACRSVAAKKLAARWQLKNALLSGCKKAYSSAATKRHAAQWQQKLAT